MTVLQDVLLNFVDCVNRTAPETPGGEYFAVGTPAMRGNVINFSEARRIDRDTFDKWTRRLVPRSGDIFLAREAPVGPVVRVPPGGKIAAGQRTLHLRPDPSMIDGKYLFYYLQWVDVQARILGLAMGSTVPHLRVADAETFPLEGLLDREIQEGVGEVLGALDDKIAANRVLEDKIWKMVDVQARAASSESSTRANLGDIARLNYGRALPVAERRGGDVAVVGSGGVVGRHDKSIVPGPCVVVGRKGSVGATYWLHGPVFPIDTTYWVEPLGVPLLYIYAILTGTDFAGMSTDSAVPGLNRDRAYAIPVQLPSPERLTMFERHTASLVERAGVASAENLCLAATRDELLPLLMSGKITVKDAEKTVEEVV